MRVAELVADAPDREDVSGLRLVWLDLRAESIDVRVDGVLVAFVAVTPHLIEELRARVDAAGMLREMKQQIELARGELDVGAAQRDTTFDGVDGEVAELEERRFFRLVFRERVNATEERFHTRDELAHVERFRQVIVSADL